MHVVLVEPTCFRCKIKLRSSINAFKVFILMHVSLYALFLSCYLSMMLRKCILESLIEISNLQLTCWPWGVVIPLIPPSPHISSMFLNFTVFFCNYLSCFFFFASRILNCSNNSWKFVELVKPRDTLSLLNTQLKFIYSEKATKFCKISTVNLSYVVTIKSRV